MERQWKSVRSVNDEPEAKGKCEAYRQAFREDQLQIDIEALEGIQRSFRKEEFIRAVQRIRQYIGQGDVFQVNLSVRQSRKLKAAPEEIYECLRLLNPSPYMGLLRFGDFQLVSASPELLVQLEDGMVRTRPIAGTRPRGASEQEDRRLAEELAGNEKERAEHVMLVDLERNDLGRISEYGTVKVDDFMVIEYYSHVMHIVSEVKGKLAQGKDAFDVIAATFPGGTITGAPKIRTMEIIEELEPVRRGPYTGAMGWIDYNGNMEFNIIIRTLVVRDGTGYIQAGAGIVIDSVPEKEYTESLNKAKALWKAIEYTERSPLYDFGHR
jgi:para-aminobenzoate synthetase component 1